MAGKLDFAGKGAMDAGPTRSTNMPTGKPSGKGPITFAGKTGMDAPNGARTSLPNASIPKKGKIDFAGFGERDFTSK